eukprot:3421530-Rhodomonas_salina.1
MRRTMIEWKRRRKGGRQRVREQDSYLGREHWNENEDHCTHHTHWPTTCRCIRRGTETEERNEL